MSLKFIFQLIRAAHAFTSWYKKASEDGKIEPGEISDFVKEFASIFGIDVSIAIPESSD